MRTLRAVERLKYQLIVWLMLHIVRWMFKIGTLTSASSHTIRYIRFPHRPTLSQRLTSLADLRTPSLCPLCPCRRAQAIDHFSCPPFPQSRSHFIQTPAWWSGIRTCLCNYRGCNVSSFPHACQQSGSYLGCHSTT